MYFTNPTERTRLLKLIQDSANKSYDEGKELELHKILNEQSKRLNSECPQQRWEGLEKLFRLGKNNINLLYLYKDEITKRLDDEDDEVRRISRRILSLFNFEKIEDEIIE